MKDEQNKLASTGAPSARNIRYTAEVGQDQALQTTTIVLSSTDQSNSSHTTRVCIAPECSSNLFSFRAGEHDLIYTDQELLKKREFTGTFVLWPFPNRVRDKSYIYQGQRYSLEHVQRQGGYPTLIYGLVFDQPWYYMQPVIGPDAVSITTYIDFNDDSPFYCIGIYSCTKCAHDAPEAFMRAIGAPRASTLSSTGNTTTSLLS
jgi:hypothetical protein